MTTVDAVGGGAPPPSPPAATPAQGGFAAYLADQLAAQSQSGTLRAAPVTLGQMVGGFAQLGLPGGPTLPAPAAPAVAEPPGPAAVPGDGAAVLAAAERYLGVPYKWGGTNPASGLDCSGFTQRVFADLGKTIPRVSIDQSRAGAPVASMAEARPGDLLFWRGSNGRPNHIAIYAGDGQMLHAPRSGDVVRYAAVRSAAPDAIRRVP